MKLRSGKQVTKKNESLKGVSEKISAKVLKRRQKEKVLYEVVSPNGNETVHSSTVSEDSGNVSSYGTGPKTAVMKHPSRTSTSSDWSGKSPSSTVTRNEDLTHIRQASLSTNFIHSGKNSEDIPVDLSKKVTSSCSTEMSPSSDSSTRSTEQVNIPLVVDVANIRKGKAVNKRKVCSVVSSILDQKSECAEMAHKDSNYILKVPSVKRRHRDRSVEMFLSVKRRRRDRSVELVSTSVKAKMSDTPEVPKHGKRPGQEDDACSVISLGSDDEVVILDSDPKPRLDCSSNSDIVIDSLPSKKHVPTSDIVTIDLCSPLSKSNKSKSPVLNKPKSLSHKAKRNKRGKERGFANSTFKEYMSVLSNKLNTAASKPNDLSSLLSHTTCQGTVPFATSPSEISVLAPALNSSVGRILDHGFVATTSTMGCSQMILNSAWTASVHGSNLHYQNPNSVRMGLQPINNQVNLASATSSSVYGNNLYNPNPDAVRMGLRPIVIDGSNVAMGHTNGRIFSCRGLKICIDYFLKRNHKVIAFVPQFRRSSHHSVDTKILDLLEKQGLVSFTPSRMIGNRLVVPYDDRYIVQYAAECGGVIVSTDNYRDLLRENPAWRETIERRLLMFTWVGDVLMFPLDPLGRGGPNLERFLRFP